MRIGNIIILILVLVILGIVGIYAYELLSSQNLVLAPVQQENILIEDKKITDQTNPFKIDAVYPQFSGLEDFNKKIQDFVDAQIKDFKQYAIENDEAVKETDPETYAQYPRKYDFVLSYETGLVNKNTVSVVLKYYMFTGGAHGTTNFKSMNYNPQTKSEIKLVDIFAGQSNYLQKISDYCIVELEKQAKEKFESAEGFWIKQGAGPKEENFGIFLINNSSIVFYFPQYQVASYAAGDFKVAMPR